MKFVRNLVVGLLFCIGPAAQLLAQTHPMPRAKSAPTPAICEGCPGENSLGQPNAGLPTYGYSSPIINHTGRYVDSSNIAQFMNIGIRSIRAQVIKVAKDQRGSTPPRIYIQLGSALGAYTLDSFFTGKLGSPMTPIDSVFGLVRQSGPTRSPAEKFAKWDQYLYPEASGSNWHCPFQDGMDRLGDFDFDDRGYVYAAYTVFGWGVVKDDGKTDGSQMTKVVQMIAGSASAPKTLDDTSGVMPETIMVFKSGTKYYAVITDKVRSVAIWDVTDPAAPKLSSKRTGTQWAMKKWDRDEATRRLAYTDQNEKLHVYDYDAFIQGGAALVEQTALSGKFADVSFDESGNVWAAESKNNFWKFTNAGNRFSQQMFSPYTSFEDIKNMHVADGYLMVAGTERKPIFFDVRLLKIEANNLRHIDIDEFFRKYYHSSPKDFAEPGSYANVQSDVQVVKWNGRTFIFYSVFGMGDVYEIEGGESINIKVKNDDFGTKNPFSKGTTPGPFVGDTVTYTAPSSNPQFQYDVTWDFGNPEVGTSSNQGGPRKGNLEISHQYSSLASVQQITTAKTVRAVAIQDSAVASQYALNLKVPTPRIGITGNPVPITSAPANLEVVAGQKFHDASDGSIEGHYSNWTIDGVLTKQAPNQEIAVGGVGAHTLSFKGSYGKYDGSFNGTSMYETPAITLTYTVRPFMAMLNTPTSNGTNVNFTATANVTSDSSIVSATQWTATWTFTPGSAGTPTVVTETRQIGTFPPFTIPKAQVTAGSTIKVQATIDPTGLSDAAKPFSTIIDTMTLSPPDPAVTITGCANANSACKFTASSISNGSMSDWAFNWTLKKDGVTFKTGTGNPFEPAVTAAGNYTISLSVTKTIFDATVEKALTVAPSLCGALPTAQQVAINKSGCGSSCAPGTTVTFWPSFNGYTKQACDSYSWTFGSGEGTGSGEEVSHTYNNPGTYTVTLTISNTNGTMTEQTTVTVSGGGTDPNPTCTAPTTASITYAGSNGCSAVSSCRTTESITFTARRGVNGLQTCDSVNWTFSDNTTSNLRQPTKGWSTPGTYTASVVISNSKGTSQTATVTITVVTPPSGNCSQAPGPGSFAILYTGPNSGCTFGGSDCQPSENISFTAQNYGYQPESCDSFEWDFGDSSPKATTLNATHAYASSGTFPVKLKISNRSGSWTYSRSVKVQGSVAGKPIPVITATSFPSSGIKGRTITFTATSDMDTTTGWTWAFGDGTTNDTSQSGQTKKVSTITHTFNKTGTMTVRVTARNSEDAATAPVGAVQANIRIDDAPAIPEYRYLLPVTAHTNGLGGSAWRTDVQIYNPDPQVSEQKPLVMEASFKGVTYPLNMIKATHIYEDFLGMLLAQQKDDSGPVIITTKSAMTPPQIWTRTYTQTAHGTFGQFIPAIRIDSNAGGAGVAMEGKYYLAGLRHNNRYRTNVGFLNPNSETVTATITVYDDRHLGIKQFTRTLQPFQLDQINPLQSIVPNLPTDRPFSLEIDVPNGKWLIAYASYIDGFSNDPVYLQAVREGEVAGADYRTTVIPGVGHTGPWRSDVTIFNPDSAAVQFDLQYFDNGGTKLAEALGVVLDPYKFLQYDDILKQGVLGDAPNGLGMLKIVATTPVPNTKYPMSFARTYNDDGANGTFGQGIGAFSAAKANVQPNKPALLAGVRNTATYRTNIGLINLANAPVNVTVTLLDPVTGAAAISVPYTLGVNQSIVGPFANNNWNGIQTGTFKIEANGHVWAFGSVIDALTADPEYVAATPTQ